MSEQASKNHQQMMKVLGDIHEQNSEIVTKIDNLEKTVTKKASIAGAVAGAITGSISGGVMGVGVELIKAKFGG